LRPFFFLFIIEGNRVNTGAQVVQKAMYSQVVPAGRTKWAFKEEMKACFLSPPIADGTVVVFQCFILSPEQISCV
jgi:hypothetical protein